VLEPGQPAPDFTLPDQDGEPVSLSDLRGKTVVVYFYPKADTTGCENQACGIRDSYDAYEAADTVVLGISRDPVEKLGVWHEKLGLPFRLLSDPDHAVAEAYGAWGERKMYGKTFMGALRNSYVIDADGIVTHVFPKIQAKKHDAAVRKALKELAAA
jgi:thioredoxin-dependent peroxiredoxin